ncbi:TPM domain-containing protein [Actinoplanes sp. NPDC049548]|uniref:TPM domain-containing protein n=1 Tax=Actinoplanes sp. NPDC049548 TaxID=3155152 RepID=UPI00342BE41C
MRSRVSVPAAVLLAAALVGMASPAQAAPAYPRATGRCVDQTGVLGAPLCKKITAILLRDEKAASDEIAVAVVPTTGDDSIEDWSTGLFNTWGVGKKDENNGVLLVVAIDDHHVRLETGRGLGDRLTDDEAQRIVDDVITPPFTDEQYPQGILAGLDEVRRTLGHRIPANARLESLAASAPNAEPDSADGGEDSGSGSGVSSGLSSGSSSGLSSGSSSGGLSSDTDSGGDFDGGSDGEFFAGGFDDSDFDDGDGSVSIGVVAVGALVLVGLVVVFIARAAGGSAGSGASAARTRGWSSPGHHNPAHHTTWMAGGFDTGSTSNSGFDSSSSSFGSSSSGFDSGSSFGGGSSDGSGASGSW